MRRAHVQGSGGADAPPLLTLLPLPEYARTAALLDTPRLQRQRLEALAITRALTGDSTRWRGHPAVRMWEGALGSLAWYGVRMCEEWLRRGRDDHGMLEQFLDFCDGDFALPAWLGERALHRSHQSNLVRMDIARYRPYFPDVPVALPYYWPN